MRRPAPFQIVMQSLPCCAGHQSPAQSVQYHAVPHPCPRQVPAQAPGVLPANGPAMSCPISMTRTPAEAPWGTVSNVFMLYLSAIEIRGTMLPWQCAGKPDATVAISNRHGLDGEWRYSDRRLMMTEAQRREAGLRGIRKLTHPDAQYRPAWTAAASHMRQHQCGHRP